MENSKKNPARVSAELSVRMRKPVVVQAEREGPELTAEQEKGLVHEYGYPVEWLTMLEEGYPHGAD